MQEKDVYARAVTIKEWSIVQREQADVGALFSTSTLRLALRKAWALSSVVDLDGRPADPGRVMASLPSAETQLAPRVRLTVATMELMRVVNAANRDKQLASQSRAWFATFDNDEYLPLTDVHPFLSPTPLRFSELARSVRGQVGPRLPADTVWERSLSAGGTDGRPSGSMRRLDARAVMHAARPDWLLCQFLDAVLAELSFFAHQNNCGAYIMPCDNFNLMMCTASGDTARIVDARKFASKWAREAGDSRSIVTLVNLSGSHWCAAHLCLDTRVVTFANSGSDSYDDIPLALRRLVMLGECAVSARRVPDAEEHVHETPWSVKRICPVLQRDGYNCGVFALRYLIGVVTGTELPFSFGGDLLRLMLINRVTSSTAAIPLPRGLPAASTTRDVSAALTQPQGSSKASEVAAGSSTRAKPAPLREADGKASAVLAGRSKRTAAGTSSSTSARVRLSSAATADARVPVPAGVTIPAATSPAPQVISVGPPPAIVDAPTATYVTLAAMLGTAAPASVVTPAYNPAVPDAGRQSVALAGIPGGSPTVPAAGLPLGARQGGGGSEAGAECRASPLPSTARGDAGHARGE